MSNPFGNPSIVSLSAALINDNIAAEEIHFGSDLGGHLSIDLDTTGVNTDKVAIALRANDAQTEDLIDVKSGAGANLFRIDKDGGLESGFGSEFSADTQDAPAVTIGGTQEEFWDGSNWQDFPIDVFVPLTYNALMQLTLLLMKLEIAVNNTTFVATTCTDCNVEIWYATDGSTFALGATAAISGTSGDVIFDTNSISIDGKDVTGNIRIRLRVTTTGTVSGLNLGSLIFALNGGLKTNH